MTSESNPQKELYELYDKRIDELYTLRDKYYIFHENSKNAEERNNVLLEKLNDLSRELESIDTEKFETKSSHLILIGKAYNVLPEYSHKAFESLTKAIKLNNKSVEAWNYLGECYWKQRDFDMCKNCFEQGLNVRLNKISLRGMSMVMRQLINVPVNKEHLQNQVQNQQDNQSGARPDQIKNLLEESIRYAKESLNLDPKDGMSWYILANCYVAKFFSPFGSKNSQLLKQAISAYNLALKQPDQSACFQSDLYFNKSMISMYEENWSDALFCLSKAFNLDPWWNEVKDNLIGTVEFLSQLNEMISSKGKIKPKKFQSLIESINKNDQGPYLDGFLVKSSLVASNYPESGGEKEIKIQLSEARLNELLNGVNSNKVLVGKVISGMSSKTDNLNIVCFTCCIADSNGDCAGLTIYNLARGQGLIIGQSVAIPEPYLETINVNFKVKENLKNTNLAEELLKISPNNSDGETLNFNFKSIRVEYPTVLVVNGKKWGKDKVSTAFFVPKIISD